MEIVYQPEPGDVLCGRGKNAFSHVGNHHFREVILENASLYETAETKQQKTQLVLFVAYAIIERGGRFLIRSNDGKSWRNGGLKQGKLKAGHAFRDVARGRFRRLEEAMRCRVQARREGEIEAKECGRFIQTNDTTLEKATSSRFSLSPRLCTIEPLKEWKTATMDPELAMEVESIFIFQGLSDLSQSMKRLAQTRERLTQGRSRNSEQTNTLS